MKRSGVDAKGAGASNSFVDNGPEMNRLKTAWHGLPLYERQHSFRTANRAVELGGWLGLDSSNLQTLWYGAVLHDIGKGLIDPDLLAKPGPLNGEEKRILRMHPQLGYELLAAHPRLAPSAIIPLLHHERWDGRGYPYGLAGRGIPLLARVAAIADTWDAVQADRPYSRGWDEQRTAAYLQDQAGEQFDPLIIEVFLGGGGHKMAALRAKESDLLQDATFIANRTAALDEDDQPGREDAPSLNLLEQHMRDILIVEDDHDFLTALTFGLTAAGHRVYGARTGEEAIRIADQFRCDAAVIDIYLPGINGLDVIAFLRRRHGNVPCVVVTGSDDDALIRRAHNFPSVEVLFKPVTPLEVAMSTEQMIRQYG